MEDSPQPEARDGFIDPLKNYFKYMVVRHPLERLGSAYTFMMREHTRERHVAQVLVKKVLAKPIST